MKKLNKLNLKSQVSVLQKNEMMKILGGGSCTAYCTNSDTFVSVSSCYSSDNPCCGGNWNCFC
jgi:natural product precursor